MPRKLDIVFSNGVNKKRVQEPERAWESELLTQLVLFHLLYVVEGVGARLCEARTAAIKRREATKTTFLIRKKHESKTTSENSSS